RWGDKRPSHVQQLHAIFAMFPDAQFVNVVRDPRATVTSVRKIGWYDGDLAGGVDLWQRSIRAVDRWRGRLAPDQLFEIQYEQLVHDPRGSLERIAAFLGLAPGHIDAMLLFHENSDVPKDAPFHPRVSKPVTTDPVRAWEDALTREEIAFVEQVLAATMRRYGYEPAAAGTPVPDEMVRRYRKLRRFRARKRLGRRLGQAKLKLTYRHPVAARPGAPS
ncbi:MAG: sulfotransferase family protein, partial [Gaiellaceae bacterium]